jgi:uncharacterized YigZ family protein
MNDSFLTIESNVINEIKVQKSKFIAQAFPIKSQLEIPKLLDEVRKKYYDASHHPYAFRVGLRKDNYRYSDDGEPSGTSGKPVLEAIDKHGLTDVLCVVTRYFGGILLGVGGLRRAYFDAADVCLENAVKIEKLLTKNINLEFDYSLMNLVMKYLTDNKIKILENNSDEKVKLVSQPRLSLIEKMKSDLFEKSNGKIIIND